MDRFNLIFFFTQSSEILTFQANSVLFFRRRFIWLLLGVAGPWSHRWCTMCPSHWCTYNFIVVCFGGGGLQWIELARDGHICHSISLGHAQQAIYCEPVASISVTPAKAVNPLSRFLAPASLWLLTIVWFLVTLGLIWLESTLLRTGVLEGTHRHSGFQAWQWIGDHKWIPHLRRPRWLERSLCPSFLWQKSPQPEDQGGWKELCAPPFGCRNPHSLKTRVVGKNSVPLLLVAEIPTAWSPGWLERSLCPSFLWQKSPQSEDQGGWIELCALPLVAEIFTVWRPGWLERTLFPS
jgi:hypothetical protein